MELDRALLRSAGQLADPLLRSLDAVHLAAALRVRSAVESFVAYDDRLLTAAGAAGLPTARPS